MSTERNADGTEKKPKNNYQLARKTEKEKKFDFVYERVIQGMRYMEIVREFVAVFKDSERTGKKYIEQVNKHLANPAPAERAKALNKARAQYEDLYGKLYAQGKYKECADVRAKMDRLEGLDRIIIDQNVNVNQETFDLAELPLEELLKLQQLMTGNTIEATSVTPVDIREDTEDVDYEEVDQNPEDDE